VSAAIARQRFDEAAEAQNCSQTFVALDDRGSRRGLLAAARTARRARSAEIRRVVMGWLLACLPGAQQLDHLSPRNFAYL